MAMFSAVGSQEASSKLNPSAPRKSARPRLSRRLFIVAMLAPRKTPRIPMYGFVETTTGALGVGAGGAASWGIAVVTGLLEKSLGHRIGVDPDNHRQSGAQTLSQRLPRVE